MGYQIDYAYTCHMGRVRMNNEDNFWCCGDSLEAENIGTKGVLEGKEYLFRAPLLAVFDGMGGESCGEMAAYLAADACGRYYHSQKQYLQRKPESFFLNVCQKMNEEVCEYCRQQRIHSMGTTVAMIGFSKNSAYVCNLGDSRIYQWENGELTQLSIDHVFSRGRFGKPPLTQFLGIPEEQMMLEPEIMKSPLEDGIKFLLCSDGLTDMVEQEKICEILSSQKDVKSSVEALKESALEAGGKDNITILLCEVQETENKKKLRKWLRNAVNRRKKLE